MTSDEIKVILLQLGLICKNKKVKEEIVAIMQGAKRNFLEIDEVETIFRDRSESQTFAERHRRIQLLDEFDLSVEKINGPLN